MATTRLCFSYRVGLSIDVVERQRVVVEEDLNMSLYTQVVQVTTDSANTYLG